MSTSPISDAAPPTPSRGAARVASGALAERLPEFPWDRLAPYLARAREREGGVVDLSVGTPVDPTPLVIQEALQAASDAHGYPTTHGTAEARESIVGWMTRRLGVDGVDPNDVLPAIGTKELVAWLPTLLGLGPNDLIVIPELAYPTYGVGARIAGARTIAADSLTQLGPERPALVWVNSPANPTGRVLPADHLRKVVDWSRERGAIVVSDECYIELPWTAQPVSVLHPSVSGGSHEGVLALHSLSKRSNLAGYRFGFAAGDPGLIASLLEARKHAGMIVPAPVQAAAIAAFNDDAHVEAQRAVYGARRERLLAAVTGAGFTVEHSEAGLYLWATRGEPCWDTVAWFADRGIVVAPGEFYGAAGAKHVRIALTATDERIAAAVSRLTR